MAIDIIARGMIESSKNDISQLFDITKGGEIVNNESSYTLNNTVDYPLLGLNLYGKSTQDGTPTPEAPVDIVSVGDGGSVDVKSCGKNLLNYDAWKTNNVMSNGTAIFENNGVTITATKNDAYTHYNSFPKLARVFVIKGETITLSWEESTNTPGRVFIFPNGKVDGYVYGNNKVQKKLTYTVPSGVSYITFRFGVELAGDTISYKNIMIERGSEATAYEPYKDNTATITSALPLCGIPVDSGGNYTDRNGQQWVCDELIYRADGTGKVVKNIRKYTFTGADNGGAWTCYATNDDTKSRFAFLFSDENIKPIYDKNIFSNVTPSRIICDKYKAVASGDTFLNINGISLSHNNSKPYLSIYDDNYSASSINDWLAYIAENPITVVYQLETPQEIELTAAEMTALRELQTFNGINNISNDGGADMDITYCTNKTLSEYVMPITTGLQKQIDELKAAVLSLGGNI